MLRRSVSSAWSAFRESKYAFKAQTTIPRVVDVPIRPDPTGQRVPRNFLCG